MKPLSKVSPGVLFIQIQIKAVCDHKPFGVFDIRKGKEGLSTKSINYLISTRL